MKDILYYYAKNSNGVYIRNEFGEIQTNFNMSLVIDGTKDSCKVNVYSYTKKEIPPNTICFHNATRGWWIVANDKVSRYENETGYLYLHEVQLEGAIELFNVRDLTDCGFNANRYTVDSFLKRLIYLSNFELPIILSYNGNIYADTKIDYLKTYENYTPLSAIRDFLDGYNCVARLLFNGTTQLESAVLDIISKTGNNTSTPRNIDDVFNDVREIRNTNKSSYGTCVISNAENVVSTQEKIYPSVGGAKLTSTLNKIDSDTAILRLPSKIFRVNYIECYPTHVKYGYYYNGFYRELGYYDSSDEDSCKKAYNDLVNKIDSTTLWTTEHKNAFKNSTSWKDMRNIVRRFPYCDNYNPNTDEFEGVYNLPTMSVNNMKQTLALTNEELGKMINDDRRAIQFKRGNDYIDNFKIFDVAHKITEISGTSNQLIYKANDGQEIPTDRVFIGEVYIPSGSPTEARQPWYIWNTSWVVNYTPMSDIKIKVDNYGDGIDSVLYNQNGKLNDSNALSKTLLSYAKEIESDVITRYGVFYGKFANNVFYKGDMPNIGDIIINDNEFYVVNNLSIDFLPNEANDESDDEIGYVMYAEVSMSKKVATKSALISPNTNIRDYGIPQNNNVKRKQLYRDFYEFDYAQTNVTNYYQPILLNISHNPQEYKEHIALIHVHFTNEVKGSRDYYYQLETTTYRLKKSIYEIVDFKDNNIIGYGTQNLWSGFDISKVFFGGNTDFYNVPISYVDPNGEVEGIDVFFAPIEAVTYAYSHYNTYDENKVYNVGDTITNELRVYTCNTDGTTGAWDSSKWNETQNYSDYSLYNNSVYIIKEIYDKAIYYIRPYQIVLSEPSYHKDALEVPVFELAQQIDDTNNVIVGENILNEDEEATCYVYCYLFVDKNKYNDNNFTNIVNSEMPQFTFPYMQDEVTYENVARLGLILDDPQMGPTLTVTLYPTETVNLINNDYRASGSRISISDKTDKDLIIVRYSIYKKPVAAGKNYSYNQFTPDLMFIFRNLDKAVISSESLIVKINNYKLN